MIRLIDKKLEEWSEKDTSCPLFIIGARQIGKTYSVKKLAETKFNDKYIYINFLDKDEYYRNLKDKSNPKEIIQTIKLISNKNIDNTWLIIFDEIQEVGELKTSLKMFEEYNMGYKIICLGSYLGNMLNDTSSFPVGKISRIELFPMNFEEFLMASNYEYLIEDIKKSIAYNSPIDKIVHDKLNDLLHEFMIVGGMPKSLHSYLKNKDIYDANEIKKSLINDYKIDIIKYIKNNSDKIKTQLLYENIPLFLSKENNKYKLSNIESTARYINYANAIESLLSTKIIYKINNIKSIEPPIKMNVVDSEFKIYYNDCGFLSSTFNLNKEILTSTDQYKYIRGSIAENFALSELVIKVGVSNINYYSFRDKSNNNYEIDFCIESTKGNTVPIEIKFGTNFQTKSLKKLIKEDNKKTSIVFSGKNFYLDKENKIYYVPLYAIGFLNYENERILIEEL